MEALQDKQESVRCRWGEAGRSRVKVRGLLGRGRPGGDRISS